jgi:hypothetical protein
MKLLLAASALRGNNLRLVIASDEAVHFSHTLPLYMTKGFRSIG